MKSRGIFLAVMWIMAGAGLHAAQTGLGVINPAPAAAAARNAATNIVFNRAPYDHMGEKGAHHRRVQHVRQLDGASVTNAYVELAVGMHYRDSRGEWQSTEANFELINGAAVARKGPHKVILNPNANTIGAVDMETPDGLRLKSHVLGLSLYDPVTGESELIAELKDVGGELVAPNQILYPDAFDGVKADLRYTYTQSGLEQDVILRERPDLSGWDATTVRLEVLTEFDEAPVPRVVPLVLRREADAVKRQQMAEPDFADQRLEFGGMAIGRGRAFDLRQAGDAPDPDRGAPVGKRFERIDDRRILFESVEVPDIQPQLQRLPAGQKRAGVSRPGLGRAYVNASPKRPASRSYGWLPARKVAAVPNPDRVVRLAQADYRSQPGLVVDYSIITSAANVTFQGDTTYYITNEVSLSGTTILEGGAVIKYAPWTSSPANFTRMLVTGPFQCKTSAYRPAFITAKDDDNVGETIAGSNGNPADNWSYYWNALRFDNQANVLVEYVNIQFGQNGIIMVGCTNTSRVRNCQFRHTYACTTPVNCTVQVENCLYYRSANPLRTENNATLIGVNLTVVAATAVPPNGFTNNATYLTNCLLVSVTNVNSYSGANNAVVSSTAGVFEPVVGGGHYLAAGSAHRNAGTTNISAALLLDLRKKTTFAPVVFSNVTFTVDTVLGPQAQRDIDALDLGYHYDPLDYLIGWTTVTNSTVLLTNGVAVGVAGKNGFRMSTGSKLISGGTADRLNVVTRYNLVQENSVENDPSEMALICPHAHAQEVDLRFTKLTATTRSTKHRLIDFQVVTNTTRLTDCQLAGGGVLLYANPTEGGSVTAAITNCLFERVDVGLCAVNGTLYNNTFVGKNLTLNNFSACTYVFKDNLFDRVALSQGSAGTLTFDYNAYVTNYAQLSPNGANDRILTASPVYATSFLGGYYLPSGSVLLDVGSRNSTVAGLYHHTTQGSQVKEATSAVDIGFHYVATGLSTNSVTDTVWVEDSIPAGATGYIDCAGFGPNDTWSWSGSGPFSGSLYHYSLQNSGLHQHYFLGATTKLTINSGETLFCYVYLTSGSLPTQLQLQLLADDGTSWAHRAYWGTPGGSIPWGGGDYMGSLPATGGWVRLEVPSTMADLAGRTYNGMAFTLNDGQVNWDRAGKSVYTFGFATGETPQDKDGDGTPDYLEDRDGDGTVDSGETSWTNAFDQGLRVRVTRPRNNAILP